MVRLSGSGLPQEPFIVVTTTSGKRVDIVSSQGVPPSKAKRSFSAIAEDLF